MPSVFTDEVGTYDLTITTSADFTVSSGGLPNGDNYVTGDGSINPTYNVNGDDFDLSDGTAWTVEFWIYYTTAGALGEVIIGADDAGGGNLCWLAWFDGAEQATLTLYNTVGGVFLTVSSSVLSTSTWHYIVLIKETGNTVKVFVDDVADGSSSSTTGTVQTPTTSTRLTFGVLGGGSNDLTTTRGTRVSKLAIYNKELSPSEINDHYLSMVAT